MAGRHTAEPTPHPRHARSGALLPIASAAVAVAILTGGAYGVSRLSAEPAGQATLAVDRTPERVSRDLRRATPTASPTAVPLVGPSLTPSARPTPPPSKATAKPAPAAAPRVLSSGSCGASFYDEPQGTANGEVFDPDAMTAAHKTLKLGADRNTPETRRRS